jgi:tetratricopeptide (TPR) repeat protein
VSSDNRLAVLAQTGGVYRLVELATGRELARFEDPDQFEGRALLTPDGTRLVLGTNNGLRVWELRRIRRELAKVDLDWDAPPFPESKRLVAPLEVRITSGEVRDPGVLNNESWRLLTGPADQRDPERALQLSQEAVRGWPGNAGCLNTLGVAWYRKGQYQKALAILEKELADQRDTLGTNHYFFLAMCHARLGSAAKAKLYYARGVWWGTNQKGLSPFAVAEMKAIRAEAEAVLGLK